MLYSQNVDINVPTPMGKLHIKNNSTIGVPQLRLTEEGSDFARIKMESENHANSFWDIAGKADTISGFSLLNFYFSNPTNSGDLMSITGLGDVGIGTTNPLVKLDIASAGDGEELLRFSTERPWVFKQTGSGLSSKLALQSTVNGKDFEILSLDGITKAATFRLWNNNPSVFLVPDNGKVGIGNNNPQHTLHVSGSFEVDSIVSFDEAKLNTAIGSNSLVSNTSGHDNTAIGFQSLTSNESGIGNTAVGSKSMLNNEGGSDNTAVGDQSLSENSRHWELCIWAPIYVI